MKYKAHIIVAGIAMILLVSCGRKEYFSGTGKGNAENFDRATFDYLYGEAIRQKLLGNAPEALKYLEQCIEMDPQSDGSFYQLAQISLQLKNVNDAKRYGLKAAGLDEKNLWYQTFLGGIYYQEKNLDSAMIFFEKASKYHENEYDVKLTLVNIYSEKGEFKKASDILTDFEKEFGTNENISLLMLKNMINAGEVDKAEEKVLELLKDNPGEIFYNGILAEIYRSKNEPDKAREIYDKLLSMDENNSQVIFSLYDFLLAEKDYDYLLELLNTLALNDSISVQDKITLLTKLLDNKDFIINHEEDFDTVLRVFEEESDNNDIIILIRPELYVKMDQKDLAIKRLEEIISIKPNVYFAWEKLLILYSETGNTDKLYTKGKECATMFNMSYPAKILYASGAMEKKKYDEALEELRKAKIIAGNQKDMILQAESMEADIYYRKGEYDKSFELFKSMVTENPDDNILLNNYSYYLAEQNRDLPDAEKMIRKVIDKEPDNNTYLDTYAWVLFKRGKNKEAINIMESIMKKDPNEDADWYEHYGYMMKAVRKCDKAVEYWKRALTADPERTNLINAIESCKK
jgi:predicted Zn-dependent protease